MSEKEKTLAESLAKACEILPSDKKEFLLGFGEGVAAMAAKQKNESEDAAAAQKTEKEE